MENFMTLFIYFGKSAFIINRAQSCAIWPIIRPHMGPDDNMANQGVDCNLFYKVTNDQNYIYIFFYYTSRKRKQTTRPPIDRGLHLCNNYLITRRRYLISIHSFQMAFQIVELLFGYRGMFVRRIVDQHIPQHVPNQRHNSGRVKHQWPIVVGYLEQISGWTLCDDRTDHIA